MKTAGHAVAVLLAVGLLSTPPAGAETGKETFAKMCVSCHAPDGGGVPALGPNLTDDCFLHGASEAEIRAVVANGSSTNPMMIGFEPQIGVESVQAVAQYVHGLIGTNVEGGRECQEAGSDAGAKAGAVAAPEGAVAAPEAAPAGFLIISVTLVVLLIVYFASKATQSSPSTEPESLPGPSPEPAAPPGPALVARQCASCSAVNLPDASFCRNCGERLDA